METQYFSSVINLQPSAVGLTAGKISDLLSECHLPVPSVFIILQVFFLILIYFLHFVKICDYLSFIILYD